MHYRGNSDQVSSPPEVQRLPVMALLALAMTGFICIMTETVPAGLLPQIAQGLHVSVSYAGQLISAYAAGSLIAAIPLTLMTRSWPRRHVILLTVLGFLLFNSLTAISENYVLTLFTRFMAGAAAGLAWSLLAGYARRMVTPSQQGKAMAIAMVGTPIALSLGVPLGTWMGDLLGWRLTFGVISGLSVLLIVWILISLPNFPGQSGKSALALRQVLMTPGVRPVLSVVMAWILAHNILYTFISPFIAQAGLEKNVSLVLLTFGIAALAGIILTGKIVERFLRRAVLLSLGIFALTMLAFALKGSSPTIVYCGVAIWGLTFGGAATLLQTALADAAGEGADIALSMNVVVWNLAIALGGIVGGVLLEQSGVKYFSWTIIALTLLGLAIASRANKYGFPPGQRQHLDPASE
ncbi:MFS transporter [Serratia sp. M24T3]|uniref:MFS transporter n=1 Tax=Serratia sp. M24T3 TaxID=932213 RepID=UPI00025BAF38|nr:MFS transporter [Serratia sp. M24T3]EIC85323.1 major facilitator family transporter [Serratia sp. M24T3]